MEHTTLTPLQRLQLVNQFRILEKLYPDEATFYEDKREIIAAGYTIQYADVFTEVYEEMDIEACRYVYDVLDMHRILLSSYNALADKEGLTLEDIRFRGFDGNNESNRYGFAEHLKKQGKWTESLAGHLNSHSIGTLSRYPQMLAKYGPIRVKLKAASSMGKAWEMTAEQIREVIS